MIDYRDVKVVREIPEEPIRDLPEPEPTIFESFKSGLAIYNLELVNSLLEKHAIDSVDEDYPDEPVLQPSEIEKKIGFKVPRPVTLRQALMMKKYFEEKQIIGKDFQKTAFDLSNPLVLLSTWVGAGIGTTLDLGNLTADAALIMTGGPLVAGANRIRKLSRLTEYAPYLTKLNNNMQKTKLATSIKNAKLYENLADNANKVQQLATRIIRNNKIRSLARVGTANALVELGIHNIEAQKGNHYAIGPALAMGVFAPVFFRGLIMAPGLAARAVGRLTGTRAMAAKSKFKTPEPIAPKEKIEGIKKKIKNKETLTDEEYDVITRHDEDLEYIIEPKIDDSPKNIFDVLRSKDIKSIITDLEKIDNIEAKAEVRKLKAVEEAVKRFGDIFLDTLTEIFSGMNRANTRIDLVDAVPWLKNPTQFKNKLKEVRQKRWGKDWKNHKVDEVDMDNMLTTTKADMEEYAAKHKMNKMTKDQPEVPEKVKDLQKRLDEKIDNALMDESPVKNTAQLARDTVKSLDDFISCVKKGGPDVS